MDELLDQFRVEARELIQQASEDLLALESTPDDRPRLQSAFRAIHTLKGSVALFDFGPMHEVLHQAEELLSKGLAAAVSINAAFIDPLLATVEWADQCLEDIGSEGTPSHHRIDQAKQLLSALRADAVGSEPASLVAPSDEIQAWALPLLGEVEDQALPAMVTAIRYQPHPECFFNGDDPLATVTRIPNIRHLKIAPREAWGALDAYDPFRCNLVIDVLTEAPLSEVEAIFRLIPDQVRLVSLKTRQSVGAQAPEAQHARQVSSSLRVDTARIDALLEIAGELVTAKNALLPLAEEARAVSEDDRLFRGLVSSHQEIERLVGALYRAVTRTRLVPLEQTFRRLPRLVRETAARLGKSVELTIEGSEVEADREIVEDLFEPLLHLVRNSLDHGIEADTSRVKSGKAARGTLQLRAKQKGEQIEVELSDDGRGIDPEKVRATALARGMLSETEAETLSEAATLQLLFAAGFSTASAVTDISGRGVGLDAVKASVQRLGGRIELTSVIGAGTTTRMILPISFAMSRIMVVEVGGERYGVPIEDITETIRLRTDQVLPVQAGEAFILRDQTIPLLRLSSLLQLPASGTGIDLRILIAKTGGERIGIVVDAIAERAETLLRPLTGLLKGLPGIAGTTVLGDGKVLLILDLEELIG